MRVPRTAGRPWTISGSTVIRSSKDMGAGYRTGPHAERPVAGQTTRVDHGDQTSRHRSRRRSGCGRSDARRGWRGYGDSSPWFTGEADVQTFDPAELVATKIRALFQRSKGRDLFDLWLAITRLGVTPEDLVACFGPYRPDGYSARPGRAEPSGEARRRRVPPRPDPARRRVARGVRHRRSRRAGHRRGAPAALTR